MTSPSATSNQFEQASFLSYFSMAKKHYFIGCPAITLTTALGQAPSDKVLRLL
jgi:hypothetical protein